MKLRDCDLCKTAKLSEYVDGRMIGTSSWAIMCLPCWQQTGIGRLGLGYGQHYRWDSEAQKYIKIAG